MKKINFALMLCFVSIVMISCTGNTPQSKTQTINVSASNSTAQWEHIGNVYDYYPQGGMGLGKDVNGVYAYIYVKQIGGQTYYKAKGPLGEVSVYQNPTYSQNDREGRYRYCFNYNGKVYYINF